MMTYKEIFDMVAVTAYNRFPKGLIMKACKIVSLKTQLKSILSKCD